MTTLGLFAFAPVIWNPLAQLSTSAQEILSTWEKLEQLAPGRVSLPAYVFGKLIDLQLVWLVLSLMFQNAVTTLRWMWGSVLRYPIPEVWLVSVMPTFLAALLFYVLARIAFARITAVRQSRARWIVALAMVGALSALLAWCSAQTLLNDRLRRGHFFYGHFFVDLPSWKELLILTAITGALLGAAIAWLSGRGHRKPASPVVPPANALAP